MDDAALVGRARAGDAAAYETLVRLHEDQCFRAAFAITGNADEARDATQDAFVKAYFHLDRFRPGAPFRPWIVRIAANEARNRRLAVGRRQTLTRRAAAVAEADVDEAAGSSEAAVLAQERRDAIVAALNSLRREDRLAIASRYFLDLSEAEMAETLGWPRGTVKSRLSRALGRLRHRLLAAAVLTLALVLGLLAVPRTRTAIADRLGLLGIRIERVPFVPLEGPTPAAEPQSTPSAALLSARLRLGEPVSMDEARHRVAYAVLVPSDAALARPDEVFVSDALPGGQVSFVYRERRGLPPARETGVSLLIGQFPGTIEHDMYAKMAGPTTRVESLTVNGGRGIWMEGAPHAVIVRSSGRTVADEVRLAANVLAWEQRGLTLRLEGALDRSTALRIARAVD